jgi:hypothetical protein
MPVENSQMQEWIINTNIHKQKMALVVNRDNEIQEFYFYRNRNKFIRCSNSLHCREIYSTSKLRWTTSTKLLPRSQEPISGYYNQAGKSSRQIQFSTYPF